MSWSTLVALHPLDRDTYFPAWFAPKPASLALKPFGGGVRVQVTHRWVNLSGNVPHACDRWRAEEQVGHVPGALGISAHIMVRSAF